MEEQINIIQLAQQNWEIAFLYGLKYLKDISTNLNDLKGIVQVHESEIQNLKKEQA